MHSSTHACTRHTHRHTPHRVTHSVGMPPVASCHRSWITPAHTVCPSGGLLRNGDAATLRHTRPRDRGLPQQSPQMPCHSPSTSPLDAATSAVVVAALARERTSPRRHVQPLPGLKYPCCTRAVPGLAMAAAGGSWLLVGGPHDDRRARNTVFNVARGPCSRCSSCVLLPTASTARRRRSDTGASL